MTKIIGIGNALTDVLVHLPDDEALAGLHLQKGGMFHIDETQMRRVHAAIAHLAPERATGGSAANTIHALAVLGHPTGFVGSVADDEVGHFFASHQQQRGIDARLNVCHEAVSGTATTLITPDGERTFATHLGASADIRIGDLRDLLGDTEGTPAILHVEGYLVQNHDLVEQALAEAKRAGATVSYDLASWNIVENDLAFVRHLVEKYVDIVFANEEEAAAYSQQRDPVTALRMLAEQTTYAVVKVGRHGAIGSHGDERAQAPGIAVDHVVDTTAAGDFFAAGFLHALTNGCPLEACLRTGNRVAAEVVQVLGTQLPPERLRAAAQAEPDAAPCSGHEVIYNI